MSNFSYPNKSRNRKFESEKNPLIIPVTWNPYCRPPLGLRARFSALENLQLSSECSWIKFQIVLSWQVVKWQQPEPPLVKEQRFFPFLHREEKTLNLRESVAIKKKIRVAGSCCMDQSSYFKCFFRVARKFKQSGCFGRVSVRILGCDSQD